MARSRSWTRKHRSLMASAMGWHGGAYPGANPRRPTAGHGLDAGVEANTLHAMHVMVPKERTLPAAKTVEGHGHRDGHVDANHAGLYLVGEGARRVAVPGEDGGAVAVLVLVDQVESVRKAGNAQYGEHGTK